MPTSTRANAHIGPYELVDRGFIGFGGMDMDAKQYWEMFLQTGAPAFYLQYKLCMMEEKHVSDDPGHRPAGNGLQ